MPLTVITVRNVPPSLRGDLTKWMQEIATGVYVGNFNRKVREELWERVKTSAGTGEATLSYADRNEIGYRFESYGTPRRSVDYDGIPLVQLLQETQSDSPQVQTGKSNARKLHEARKFTAKKKTANPILPYIVLDIETDGLDPQKHRIIELGAIRVEGNAQTEFHALIQYEEKLPEEITKLTGITNELLQKEGIPIEKAMQEWMEFAGDTILIGYGIDFDCRFLNAQLRKLKQEPIRQKTLDVMRWVKKEKMLLPNYRLATVLPAYGIQAEVPHRALQDARLICELAGKVNQFLGSIK
ncbi:MAG: type I-E CRISPR-associated endoribonuclease Cas2e [Peptoniphilaceae bacterium]